VRILFGSTALYMRVPDFLNGRVEILPDSPFPTYRLAIIAVGLAERAEMTAAALSHGEKRALEIAMVLATRPLLLLLDEPMAGMGPAESAEIVRLLAGLKGRLAIVLVEHDMDAVFALADRITVMVYGRVIATGTPGAIRADGQVRRAYLGDEGA